MTTREKIEVMQAFLDKKPIEIWLGHRWAAWQGDLEPKWNWNEPDCIYRIKPSPVKRLLKPEELPPVFWVRLKDDIGSNGPFMTICSRPWHLITKVDELGSIWYFEFGRGINVTTETHEWSLDRKTVHSFYTEEA